MARVGDLGQIRSKRKAVTALFAYAVRRERDGDGGMIDVLLDVIRLRAFTIGPQITALFNEGSPDSLNRVIALVSPYAPWDSRVFHSGTVTHRWATAVLGVPYTEEIGRSAVDAVLQIASIASLQPYIPVGVWALLKEQPSLPPVCLGQARGTTACVVRGVRKLRDIEILKSYLFLVWSEWYAIHPEGYTDMCASIREDFCGIGMVGHRKNLLERLEHVLRQLGQGLGNYQQYHRLKRQYKELKGVLLEVDKEATEVLTRTPSGLTNLFDSLTGWYPQNPIQRSPVPSHSRAHSCMPTAPLPRACQIARGSRVSPFHHQFFRFSHCPRNTVGTRSVGFPCGKRACCTRRRFHLCTVPSHELAVLCYFSRVVLSSNHLGVRSRRSVV